MRDVNRRLILRPALMSKRNVSRRENDRTK